MASRGGEDAAIADIAADDKPVAPTLYQAYSSNLRKAVDAVFADGRNAGTADRLRANVSRFAAYKAWHATAQVREALDENGGDLEAARRTLRRFNRWQAAEYNTAVARSRTAKQWQQWNDGGDNSRVFPNIVWLPSMSATPREEHRAFWNRVWPKDDPFWDTNQPGNLWNCKCDWEQTDEPVSQGNPAATVKHDGLEGNPAKTGEIFTDNAAYVKKSGNSNSQRKKAELKIADGIRPLLEAELKGKLVGEKAKCSIDGVEHEVMFFSKGIEEAAQSMKGTKTYWIKNEILPRISEYIRDGHYIQRVRSDATHNINAATVRLKRNTDWFYYFSIKLPDGTDAYINIGHFKDTHPDPSRADRYYFYTITKQLPSY